jgi:hypothetical protein
MPIEFRCTRCAKLLRTPDESAGQAAVCPECGEKLSVPATPQLPQAGPAPAPFAGDTFGSATANPYSSPQTNPYSSPQTAGSRPVPGLAPEEQVQAPAAGLIAIGGLGLGMNILALPFYLPLLQPPWREPAELVFLLVCWTACLAFSVVVMMGGIKMRKMQSYNLAMAGSILALVPCLSPCCFIGLPIGIWSLTVLCNYDVREAFRNAHRHPT